VVDRVVDKNRHSGAHYTVGTITDHSLLEQLLKQITPTVVFHLASPNASFPTGPRSDFYHTNVEGTRSLLALAAASPSVKAFVHCSTVDIYEGPPHVNTPETHPLFPPSSFEEYARTKAIADTAVLDAAARSNDPRGLRIVSLRIAHMYGSRCSQQLPALLALSAGGGPLVRLGNGTNLCSVVSSDNAAAAHILAAKALLDPARANGKIHGEAFNIAEPEPVLFWYHTMLFWAAARGRPVTDEVWTVPTWLVRIVYGLIAWGFWLCTAGQAQLPVSLSYTTLTWTTEDHTYSTDKARKRLGWSPKSDHDVVIRRSVE
ncbi:hypothetical protein B0T26DRAFT_627430, partial [Lasiosphaeria miniovina]